MRRTQVASIVFVAHNGLQLAHQCAQTTRICESPKNTVTPYKSSMITLRTKNFVLSTFELKHSMLNSSNKLLEKSDFVYKVIKTACLLYTVP